MNGPPIRELDRLSAPRTRVLIAHDSPSELETFMGNVLEALRKEGIEEDVAVDAASDRTEAMRKVDAISATGDSYALCIIGTKIHDDDGELS